ncbi:hypothetical protein P152DRAFT_187067 [Eremomyces bilateralis CBS 781.70]|uniref:Uncharacterized protein n=1 Tax=Eremomyces bilateralis CBS 781.70 TaxID=1392243 RepID=A0A6G1GBN4_9PEZI|nr:uncharacterized protein P152DRAFT_187067 [Eremomyces bilateralis CBS 781.70]KAF1815495.1 hypothetical protein P152DRAFT_187067 [Eremomyces bilateralis CBS 781.70]
MVAEELGFSLPCKSCEGISTRVERVRTVRTVRSQGWRACFSPRYPLSTVKNAPNRGSDILPTVDAVENLVPIAFRLADPVGLKMRMFRPPLPLRTVILLQDPEEIPRGLHIGLGRLNVLVRHLAQRHEMVAAVLLHSQIGRLHEVPGDLEIREEGGLDVFALREAVGLEISVEGRAENHSDLRLIAVFLEPEFSHRGEVGVLVAQLDILGFHCAIVGLEGLEALLCGGWVHGVWFLLYFRRWVANVLVFW